MDINLLDGQILDGRYVIQSKIGEGGMGAVYRAVDNRNLNRAVALKVISSKNQFFNTESAHLRLKREKEAYLRITHPNVVQIYDSGSTPEGDLYIVQEFIAGESLESFLKKRKQASFEDICWIVPQVAAALEAAHSEGIIH
ncbi:MAG: protein kinase, partial [Candidatus Bathyarchaeia archaeon]